VEGPAGRMVAVDRKVLRLGQAAVGRMAADRLGGFARRLWSAIVCQG
jgi:hypothetical protein